jgi:hypothetical protein
MFPTKYFTVYFSPYFKRNGDLENKNILCPLKNGEKNFGR